MLPLVLLLLAYSGDGMPETSLTLFVCKDGDPKQCFPIHDTVHRPLSPEECSGALVRLFVETAPAGYTMRWKDSSCELTGGTEI